MAINSLALALITVGAQDPARTVDPARNLGPEVRLVGGVRAACVTPGGDVWFLTRIGHAYRSRDHGRTWSEVSLPIRESGKDSFEVDYTDQIGFFDANHGLISGSIGDEDNLALVTEDGGDHWSPVRLPENSRSYDAWFGPGSNAWLVGSFGTVLHTKDAGLHWLSWGRPFNPRLRTSAVCARDERNVFVAADDGSVLATEDGGEHWRSIPGPGEKIEHLFLAGDHLLSDGEESVRICDDQVSGEWRELALGTGPCIRLGRHPDGLLCQLRTLEVLLLDDRLAGVRRFPARLDEQANVLVGGNGCTVALLDAEGQYALLEESGANLRHMQAAAGAPWTLVEVDRAATGPLFGASRGVLAESADGGRTWRGVVPLDGASLVRALADGSGAFVRDRGGCWLWSSKDARFVPVPALAAFNLQFECTRREPLWLAIGSRYEGERAQRMLRMSDTVDVGEGFESLVCASADGGRSWSEFVRIPECTVAASFLGDDGVLSLLLTNGTVQRLPIEVDPAREGRPAHTRIAGPVAVQPIRPMPQWACWIEFVNGGYGSLGGNLYFQGPLEHRTSDGGRRWVNVPRDPHGPRDDFRFLRLGGGAWMRLVEPYKEPAQLDVWEKGAFRPLKAFEGPLYDAHVDAAGRLLLRTELGATWSLSADGTEWSRLADMQVPAH